MSIEEIQDNVEQLDLSEPGPSNGQQSRAEKKARAALANLGLKQIPGVTRVVLRRPRNVMFVLQNPEVYHAPGSDIHIAFGEFKVEDPSQLQAASQLAASEAQDKSDSKKPEDIMTDMNNQAAQLQGGEKGKESAQQEEDDENVDETGVDSKDIELVMAQVGCSKGKAVKALKENNSDLVNAIMALSS